MPLLAGPMELHGPPLGRSAPAASRGRPARLWRPATASAAAGFGVPVAEPEPAGPAPREALRIPTATGDLLLLAGGLAAVVAAALLAREPAWTVPVASVAIAVRFAFHQSRIARLVSGWQPGGEVAADAAVRTEDAHATVFVVAVTLAAALLWIWRAFAP
jgi:hypothetical protein